MNRRRAVAASVSLAVLAGCYVPNCRCSKSITPSPIKLRVIDAKTLQPISGACVSYGLQTEIYPGGLRPIIDMHEGAYRIAFTLDATTDPEGNVFFAPDHVRLESNEYLHNEWVFVNMSVNRDNPRVAREVTNYAACKKSGAYYCDPQLNDVTLIHKLLTASFRERASVYANPDPLHRGVVLTQDGFLDGWDVPGDRFRLQHGLPKPSARIDTITVALEPYSTEH